jgi:hypothetical protein
MVKSGREVCGKTLSPFKDISPFSGKSGFAGNFVPKEPRLLRNSRQKVPILCKHFFYITIKL